MSTGGAIRFTTTIKVTWSFEYNMNDTSLRSYDLLFTCLLGSYQILWRVLAMAHSLEINREPSRASCVMGITCAVRDGSPLISEDGCKDNVYTGMHLPGQ